MVLVSHHVLSLKDRTPETSTHYPLMHHVPASFLEEDTISFLILMQPTYLS